ncbi:hypothetical protein CPB85DRAFT_1235077 [Mucidula mucida]|nr:hypothetical protein CPB85DRAFT_1235077 [Mucidula mucida]
MGTARPMSPSQLRELDLTHDPDSSSHPRKYPTPPTGHDLMAMFPPAPPSIFPARGQNTSGYFQRQERAFFAQAGKEIVRVRVEVDLPHGSGSPHDDKPRHPMDPGPRSWAPSPAHSHSHPPQPPPPGRRNGPVPVNPADADEAWKRPMPFNERRRAGKHTRRVIVRN